MQQFFIDRSLEINTTIELPDDIARQCRLVLRYKEGEIVRLAGNDKHVFLATLHFNGEAIRANVYERLSAAPTKPIEITLIQALIRKEKWEFFLQKTTEVGVHRIVPLILERNVVKWDKTDETIKMARFRKIVKEAAEQCRRPDIPIIETPISLKELDRYRSDLNFTAYELEDSLNLKDALSPCSSVSVIMGSEGGISPLELTEMSRQGFKPVSLGPRILRAETAGIVVCTMIDTRLG